MECIHRHDFDTILMAMNAADPHHYSFNEALLPLAVEKQMGIIGMKIPGRGRILSTWTPPPIEQQKHSWEGMTIQTDKPGTLNMREAMYYTLSRPVSTVIIGCDTTAHSQNVQLARNFTPINEKQQTELQPKPSPARSRPSSSASTTARKAIASRRLRPRLHGGAFVAGNSVSRMIAAQPFLAGKDFSVRSAVRMSTSESPPSPGPLSSPSSPTTSSHPSSTSSPKSLIML
jgi:hypothetical protein